MLDVGCLFSSTGSHFMDPDERSFLRIGNSRTSALALGGGGVSRWSVAEHLSSCNAAPNILYTSLYVYNKL